MANGDIVVSVVDTNPAIAVSVVDTNPTISIRLNDSGVDTAFITGNSYIRITTSGLWLYNATTSKWNLLTNVGTEQAEQLQLGAAASSPS